MQPHPTKKRLRSQSCGAKNTNMLLGIIYFHKNMLHNLRPLQKIETTHGSMSKRTTIRVVAASFWRSDPWTERISPTTSARGKLFTTHYNDGNIYMQWEREETWELKVSVSKHLKMINTPDQELVGPDHRSVSQDVNNTCWRYEADHELMFGDLVHVRDASNFKTIQSHNGTGFQTRPELAGPVSGDETMNHRVL